MALKRVDERLSRLTSMVEKWNKSGDVPRIERDMALEELRRIYDELLDYNPRVEAEPNSEVVAPEAVVSVATEVEEQDESVAESAAEEAVAVAMHDVVVKHDDLGDAFDDALDIDALLGLSGDDPIEEAEAVVTAVEQPAEEEVVPTEDAEPVEEQSAEETEALESAEVPTVEEVVTQSEEDAKAAERPTSGGLFDIDDIPVRTKGGRKMISLYDTPVKRQAPVAQRTEERVVKEAVDAEKPAAAPQPAVVAPQEEEAPQRLGDVIAKSVTTLGDKMAGEQPTAAYNRITDIRKAIGLNDKFLMIRDLFGGDANLYEDTITRLNEFDDIDECMIFIVENFRWNPDSEGAKLLVSLIERKLS